MAVTQLVVHRAGDIGEGEPPGLRRDRRVEEHLEQDIAELFLERVDALVGVGRQPVDRLEELVALLEQVPLERLVGLLTVPGAPGPQGVDQLVELHQLRRNRLLQRRDVDRREVVRLDTTVEVGPLDLEDALVGQAQPLDDRDRLARPLLDRELHVAQDQCRVALGNEQRAALAGGIDGEPMTVDHPHAGRDGVDPQPGPGEVEEGQGRHDLGRDAGVVEEQLHRPLGDERRSGDGVHDPIGHRRRLHQAFDDGRVHLVHGVGGVVDVVEERRPGQHRCRGVPLGPGEHGRRRGDRRERARRDEVVAAGAEPDDDDGGDHCPWRPARSSADRASAAAFADGVGANGARISDGSDGSQRP